MAVTGVWEIVGDRGGTLNIDGTRRYRREFQVTTDNPATDGMLTAATAVDPVTGVRVPQLGTIYSFGPEADLAVVETIEPRPEEDDADTWRVLCGYLFDPKKGEQPPPEEGPPNPFLKPTLWGFNTDPREKVFDKDIEGTDVVNAAGQPFDPPYLIPNNNWNAVATKNVPYVTGAFINAWANGVNQSAFQGAQAKRLWISSIVASPVEDAFWGPYHQLQLQFSFNSEKDWDPVSIANVGKYQRATSGPFSGIRLVKCLDASGQPVSEPVRLDTIGVQAASSAALNYRSFRGFRLLEFSGLGL